MSIFWFKTTDWAHVFVSLTPEVSLKGMGNEYFSKEMKPK